MRTRALRAWIGENSNPEDSSTEGTIKTLRTLALMVKLQVLRTPVLREPEDSSAEGMVGENSSPKGSSTEGPSRS